MWKQYTVTTHGFLFPLVILVTFVTILNVYSLH
jgi:hypothetical protein